MQTHSMVVDPADIVVSLYAKHLDEVVLGRVFLMLNELGKAVDAIDPVEFPDWADRLTSA